MGQFIQKIALHGVRCNAGHGWYPEEQLIGNWFSIDAEASFKKRTLNEQLDLSLNYEVMNQIILDAMKIPRKLLETVAEEILNELIGRFAYIETASVVITKHKPAMLGDVSASVVSLNYSK